MLDNLKASLAAKQKSRHEAKCAAGKHDWFLFDEETIEYSYSSVGGGNPSFTTKTYKCRWCDAEDIQTEGDADQYHSTIGDDEFS